MTNIFDKIASEATLASSLPETTIIPSHPDVLQSDEGQTRTPSDIRKAVQELLKYGYVEETVRQDLFRGSIIHEKAINEVLEPLNLALRIDTYRGVAFLTVVPNENAAEDPLQLDSEDDGWSHPLVRKQRLTLEQSLLVAILRQFFVLHEQEKGVGQSAAKVTIEELLSSIHTYFPASGSDARDENRLLQLLDQLKTHGIVSEVDSKNEITIRPLIAHLASPESLTALLTVLKEKVQQASENQGTD